MNQQDPKFIILNNPFNFTILPKEQQNEENALFAISLSPNVFSLLQKELHTTQVCDRAVCSKSANSNKCYVSNLQFVEKEHQTDELCIAAFKISVDAIKYIKNFSAKVSEYIMGFVDMSTGFDSKLIFNIEPQYQTVELWNEYIEDNLIGKDNMKLVRPDLLNNLGKVERQLLITYEPYALEYLEKFTQDDFISIINYEHGLCQFCKKTLDRTKMRTMNCKTDCLSKKYMTWPHITENDIKKFTEEFVCPWRILEYLKTDNIVPHLEKILGIRSITSPNYRQELEQVLGLYEEDIIKYLLAVGRQGLPRPNEYFIGNVISIITKYFGKTTTSFDDFIHIARTIYYYPVNRKKAVSKINYFLCGRPIEKAHLYQVFQLVNYDIDAINRVNISLTDEDYCETVVRVILKVHSQKASSNWVKALEPFEKDKDGVFCKLIGDFYKDTIKTEVPKIVQPVKPLTQQIAETKNCPTLELKTKVLPTVTYNEPAYCEVFDPLVTKTYNKFAVAIKNNPEWISLVPKHLLTKKICKMALEGGCSKEKIPEQYKDLLKCCPEPSEVLYIQYGITTKDVPVTKTMATIDKLWDWKIACNELEKKYGCNVTRIYKNKSNKLCFYSTKPTFTKVAQAVFYTN